LRGSEINMDKVVKASKYESETVFFNVNIDFLCLTELRRINSGFTDDLYISERDNSGCTVRVTLLEDEISRGSRKEVKISLTTIIHYNNWIINNLSRKQALM